MKRFIILIITVAALQGLHLTAFGQNEEYYKPDSARRQRPQQTTMSIPSDEKKQPEVPFNKYEQVPFLDRLRLGGSFGLSFGTVTNINLSPMAGVNLTEKLVGGVGATYMWFRSRLLNINSSYYGGRTFLMYSVLPMVNIQAEYEVMNVQYYNSIDRAYTRKWIGSPMVGGSYVQPLGGRFTKTVQMTLLYSLNYQNQLNPFTGQNISPYSSPFVFRVTFL
jgi:hypothetical protein